MRRTVIYLATPMRFGHWTNNVRVAAKVARDLMRKGYSVINPINTGLADLIEPMTIDEWLDNDFGLIDVSDYVFRVPGKSEGADQEADYAVRSGKPLFTDLTELYAGTKPTIQASEE